MQSTLFQGRIRSGLAGLLSGVALIGLAAYTTAPTAQPSLAATYQASALPAIEGIVKTPAGKPVRGAAVTVSFRDKEGHFVRRVTVRVSARGRFAVPVPRAAFRRHRGSPGSPKAIVMVKESASDGARRVSRSFPIRLRRALKLTATFPPRESGLLPGLFPY